MALKSPIRIVGTIRDWNDTPVALAETDDGGASVVGWSSINSSWVELENLSAASVAGLPLLEKARADSIQ